MDNVEMVYDPYYWRGGFMIYCPQCGAENEDEAPYCKKCKFSLKAQHACAEKEALKTNAGKRSLDASYIFYIVFLVVVWLVIEFFTSLGVDVRQYFKGEFGEIILCLVLILGLLSIIGVLIFFNWLLTKLGLRGLNLFQKKS